MPVTFQVSDHPAESMSMDNVRSHPLASAGDALESTARASSKGLKEVLQSSIGKDDLETFVPCPNGFVDGCLRAYNTHQNLVLRPDDVWIAIISQFAMYVEARDEEMRQYFVGDQEGKKKLVITTGGNRYSDNIKDKDLRDWIIPGFSTTTPNDKVVGAVLMMCTLKNYFEYGCVMLCGIPAVTLDGTQDDWVALRLRLDKLLAFGDAKQHPHLHDWHQLLVPIFDNFVDCFTVFADTAPADKATKTRADELKYFFQHICARDSFGSGFQILSGWIAFFSAFNKDGQWQLKEAPPPTKRDELVRRIDPGIYGKKDAPLPRWDPELVGDIPPAYGEVPVELNDNGQLMEAKMVAGMVGYNITGEKMDTVNLTPGWWMFVVDDKKSAVCSRCGFCV